jgi:hypothetical protein
MCFLSTKPTQNRREISTHFWLRNQGKWYYREDLGVEGRIMSRLMSARFSGRLQTGFVWLWTWINGRHFWAQQWTERLRNVGEFLNHLN